MNTAEAIERIRHCSIHFLFAAGRQSALRNLMDEARILFSENAVTGYLLSPRDVGCFEAAANVFQRADVAAQARNAFEAAGRTALGIKANEWTPEKTKSRLIGYGNAAGLTVFYYNIPASSLTALWVPPVALRSNSLLRHVVLFLDHE